MDNKKNITIIGSGIAGCILAHELQQQYNVTVVEKGPENGIRYPDIEFTRKTLAAVNTFCYGHGGGSNIWHNGLMPLSPKDLNNNEDFSTLLADSQQHIDKSAEYLNFSKPNYSEEYSNVRAQLTNSNAMQKIDAQLDCLVYPKKFAPLTLPSNVTRYFDVEDFEFIKSGTTVTGLKFEHNKQMVELASDLVICSAGAFNTPLLLQKLTNQTSNYELGKGLIDHPVGFVGKIKVKDEFVADIQNLASLDTEAAEVCSGIKLSLNNYNAIAFLRPAVTMSNNLGIYKFKSKLGASSGVKRIKNAFNWRIFHPDIVSEICNHLFNFSFKTKTFNVLIYFEQKKGDFSVSNSNGRVSVDWELSKQELSVYSQIIAKLAAQLEPITTEQNFQTELTTDWLWSGAHHAGTVNMGENKAINSDLKVAFANNVYCCDSSAIQEHSYTNTGVTIGQLAIRLAEHIRGKY